MAIKINTIATNMLQEQTYILHDETKECVIIDPGFYSDREKESIDTFMKNMELKLVAIWFTHLHLDHTMGAQYLMDKYNVPTFASELDLSLTKMNKALAISWGINAPVNEIKICHNIKDGDVLTFGNSSLKALHVPGHSPGGMVYYSEEDAFCIGGDVLFRCSVGRSDFPGGDERTLINAIQQKLLVLPGETMVFPGHGGATTIDDEKRYNPYLQQSC